MKYCCYILLIIFFVSCSKTKRDFFQSVKKSNHFLDTFSLSNLNGFGLDEKAIFKNGKNYFDFNSTNNSIYSMGYFSNDSGKIFFLPEQAEEDLLFADTSFWNSTTVPTRSYIVVSKSKTVYEVDRLGLFYNLSLNDSVLLIRMRVSNVLNRTETLIFELSKKLDMLAIKYVNCKNDTLIMNFSPKQEVYFKHLDESSKCL